MTHFDLLTPGPTPAPEVVKQAYLNTGIYHRSRDFEEIVLQTAGFLQELFGCESLPVFLTSSGTGAMEAAVVNLTEEGDEALVVSCGKFGERWFKLADAYKCRTHHIESSPGAVPSVYDIESTLRRHPNPKVFFVQAHETSTGALLPLKEMIDCVRRLSPSTLIVVDAISSLGAHELDMRSMGIDCALSGSQKGFGVAPGLAFVALSERAWVAQSRNKRPKFYFDLGKERKGQTTGRCAYTPAISLILGLNAALGVIIKKGFDAFVAEHQRRADGVRKACEAMGLEFFLPEAIRSNVLTSIRVPSGVDGVELLKYIRAKHGVIISGGQDDLKGKIIRLSHLGFVSDDVLVRGVGALEDGLLHFGHKSPAGVAVKSLQQHLASCPAHFRI